MRLKPTPDGVAPSSGCPQPSKECQTTSLTSPTSWSPSSGCALSPSRGGSVSGTPAGAWPVLSL
eukprot:11176411-Lingulodinium_polyedra.AAC.1